MKHLRGRLRDDVRTALRMDNRTRNWTIIKSWGRPVAEEQLPAIGVLTPTVDARLITGIDVERTTRVVVVAQRSGADELEDELDDDAEVVERLVLPVLATHAGGGTYGYRGHTIALSGEGDRTIGKLEVNFDLELLTSEDQQE